MKFINRKIELDALTRWWNQSKPHLIILYGKRRVGKTELIKQFVEDKPAIYFLADKRSSFEQLRELGRLTGTFFKDSVLQQNGFASWLDVFRYLKDHSNKRCIFVVDEFPCGFLKF